ncbi:MAG: aminomethyl-transferring glycine dehydrogenase [Candidatus Tectomicrobia bacterium]|uniref:Glycine dehydrogenase (decarboxylating) n=1 Tax=Tectimicrobiota bacterium TaxID=2528274 RepID=A0A932I0C7_UNCTE|nr:aminomethyl-transferring glycine dehydrogenase [Candidatus Tectomicrobia bacterium]
MPGSPETLLDLEHRGEFIRRHIGPAEEDAREMLRLLGLGSLDELTRKAIPASILSKAPLRLPEPRTEQAALAELRAMAGSNRVLRSMIGMGYSDCHTPAVILRNVLENPGWYTAYTPYQPEISQGRLEALLNFQTMVIDLTGMEIANASLLDEGTAAAEAMTMSRALSKAKGGVFFVSNLCHPQVIEVVGTRAEPLGIEVAVGDHRDALVRNPFGVLLAYPGTTGEIPDYRALVQEAHAQGALVTFAADLLALALLTPPGELGADIVVGNSQRFGVPLGFGGPHAAYFATRDAHKRSMPGRIVGVSIDAKGRPALRLSLQTREQHIRREKATSNICTAQVLLAVMASMYAVYHGPEGIRRIARRAHRMACVLAEGLRRLGHTLRSESFFDTLTVNMGKGGTARALERARERGMNLRPVDADTVGVSLDETTRREDLAALFEAFSKDGKPGFTVEELDAAAKDRIPEALRRTSAFLTHPVFNRYHSETEMMRYLARLEEKDVSLTRSMIPLGSCTMKLNAAAEMIPVTWREIANLHPFAPADQVEGYRALTNDLEARLAEITGFDAVSLQPNSGAQGEYTGLLVIRAYHRSRGEGNRHLCLIPSSAHGTNPASAVMAGMEVAVVACDKHGNVDVADLRAKAEANRDRLAALMITYPSTHGVFEEAVIEICDIVHRCGGQVYMDGANLNALVGLCRPGEFGPDVSHLNLHKTFCIPHGGGGPGMGPIGVRKHLAPFLPRHSVRPEAGPGTGITAVSAAPWGSAAILPISWTYIAMMGGRGLKKATQAAILNANYIAKRLEGSYEVLYRGPNGMVAHECIVDFRKLEEASGVTVEDVAKRLMDFGFHAPTMSFPVAGTLMIEPTESESKEELDRFCEAMLVIREEIREVEEGFLDRKDNPLTNAPHTASDIAAEAWPHPYPRERAVFPLPWVRRNKYWPPVNRVNNPHGDRHLICACPPIEEYEAAAEGARTA